MENSKKIGSYGSYGLHIMKCPTGKFIYVGTVPVILLHDGKDKFGQQSYTSLLFDTMQDAESYFNSVKHLID